MEQKYNAVIKAEPQDFPDMDIRKELKEPENKNLSTTEYIDSLIALANRMTEARDFYKEKCERLETQKIQTWEKKMK